MKKCRRGKGIRLTASLRRSLFSCPARQPPPGQLPAQLLPAGLWADLLQEQHRQLLCSRSC